MLSKLKKLSLLVTKFFRSLFKRNSQLPVYPTLNLEILSTDRLTIDHRIQVHQQGQNLLISSKSDLKLANYFLGNLNYSASYVGQKLRNNETTLASEIQKADRLWDSKVAGLIRCLVHSDKNSLLEVIDTFYIDYLKISMASEIAMILRPDEHMIINKRVLFILLYTRREQLMDKMKLNSSWPQDPDELMSWILSSHSRWNKFYPHLISEIELLYHDLIAKQLNAEQKKWKYFYIEAYINYHYQSFFPQASSP